MARGIEELTEMQVTGPVQGGDMVMKPDQTPVGAAALLNKMSRQNTPGIFKLPMPDKQMPDFMKVAAEGVEQQTAKGDTINQMAGELIRQGIDTRGLGMDEIIKIYEETFGSPGDVDQFGVSKVDPSDWRTILQMINSGMSEEEIDAQVAAAKFPGNFTDKKQNVVELPRNLKTGPDNPETELAYITDDEKAMLAFLNPGTPHEGPEGVPTYDEDPYDEQQKGQTYTQAYSGGSDSSSDGGFDDSGREGAIAGGGMSLGSDSPFEPGSTADASFKATQDETAYVTEAKGGDIGDYKYHSEDEGRKYDEEFAKSLAQQTGQDPYSTPFMETLLDTITLSDPLYQSTSEIPNYDEIEKLIKNWKRYEGKLGGLGIMDFASLLAGPKYKEGSKKLLREVGEGEPDEFTLEGLREKIKELGGDQAIESLKHLKPELYYKFVDATTGGAVEDLSKAKLEDLSGYSLKERQSKEYKDKEAYNRKVFEAREVAAKERDAADKRTGQGRGYGGGSDVIEEKLEEIIETPTTTDPRAGAFSVGGTMPYTDAIRTAGVETDVPLGRRFQVDKEGKYRGSSGMDLSEAMKYATLGGYGQLEPFQEYLTRRRKHLGEDKPQWFDEEGNVIYSETA